MEQYLGSWTQFLGCGTNGGRVTNIVINADGSGTCQRNQQSGASGGHDSEGSVEKGTWEAAAG